MAIDVSEMKELVKDAINRGSTYDSVIFTYIGRAVRFLEQNFSFNYMRYKDEDNFRILVDTRSYDFPEFCKRFIDWEWTGSDGSVTHMKKVQPFELGEIEDGDPSVYYTEGDSLLWLDKTPDTAYSANLWYYRYTDWANVELSDSPWLVVNAEGLLRVQTVILMGPRLRDPKLIALMNEEKKEHLRVMSIAETDLSSGDDDAAMGYAEV